MFTQLKRINFLHIPCRAEPTPVRYAMDSQMEKRGPQTRKSQVSIVAIKIYYIYTIERIVKLRKEAKFWYRTERLLENFEYTAQVICLLMNKQYAY